MGPCALSPLVAVRGSRSGGKTSFDPGVCVLTNGDSLVQLPSVELPLPAVELRGGCGSTVKAVTELMVSLCYQLEQETL